MSEQRKAKAKKTANGIRHTSLGFYFPLSQDEANALRARLNDIAGHLGYIASEGPSKGKGVASALLMAIVSGEVELYRAQDAQETRE